MAIKGSRRQRRVAELIHQEISRLLQQDLRDPRLGFITVTGVDVSPDLKLASVYISLLDDSEAKLTLQGLSSARPYLRRALGESLSLRYVPQLTFKIDPSIEYGQRMETLFAEIEQQRSEPGDEDND